MDYLPNGTIREFIKTETIKKLEDLKGNNIMSSLNDLSYYLFSIEDMAGGYFGDNKTARKFIIDNFLEINEILKQIKSEFGINYKREILFDIFSNTDYLMVAIMIETANYLIAHCDIAHNHLSDEELIFTDKIINRMIEEIKEF